MRTYPSEIRMMQKTHFRLGRCPRCKAPTCSAEYIRNGVQGVAAVLHKEVILTGKPSKASWTAGDWHRCEAPQGRRPEMGGVN